MGRRVTPRAAGAEDSKAPEQTAAPAPDAAVDAPAQAPTFSVDDKIESIKASAMPEHHKQSYIAKLRGTAAASSARVPFATYATMRKIKPQLHKGMQAYPKAAGVSFATAAEWDDIFKDF